LTASRLGDRLGTIDYRASVGRLIEHLLDTSFKKSDDYFERALLELIDCSRPGVTPVNLLKIVCVAALTTLIGVLAYTFTNTMLRSPSPLDHGSVRVVQDAASTGSRETPASRQSAVSSLDGFLNAARHSRPTIKIRSRIDSGPWVEDSAIYPLRGRNVALKVEKVPGGQIRWYQIIPDISKIYKNANFPWDPDPYQWIGFAKIDYHRKELTRFRDRWRIHPFDGKTDTLPIGPTNSSFYHDDVGSFWFQAEVATKGRIYRSAGIEDSDKRGLSPKVFRVSVRACRGYIGYLTSFFNVPGLFGSTTYQSNNYIGVDCADVLVAAHGKWQNRPIKKNYNVAMLVRQWPKAKEFDLAEGTAEMEVKWDRDIRPGWFIAVRYGGQRQYQHVGALFRDANKTGILDRDDLVIHAGPGPLKISPLREGNFDGHVVVLRSY